MFKNDSKFAISHAGSAGFAPAKVLLFRKKNAAVIVLTNTAEGGLAAEEFCFNMLPEFGMSIPDLKVSILTDSVLNGYSGTYGSSPCVTVTVDKGNFKMKAGDNTMMLKPSIRRNIYQIRY